MAICCCCCPYVLRVLVILVGEFGFITGFDLDVLNLTVILEDIEAEIIVKAEKNNRK